VCFGPLGDCFDECHRAPVTADFLRFMVIPDQLQKDLTMERRAVRPGPDPVGSMRSSAKARLGI
jgi:hypothetical protein